MIEFIYFTLKHSVLIFTSAIFADIHITPMHVYSAFFAESVVHLLALVPGSIIVLPRPHIGRCPRGQLYLFLRLDADSVWGYKVPHEIVMDKVSFLIQWT